MLNIHWLKSSPRWNVCCARKHELFTQFELSVTSALSLYVAPKSSTFSSVVNSFVNRMFFYYICVWKILPSGAISSVHYFFIVFRSLTSFNCQRNLQIFVTSCSWHLYGPQPASRDKIKLNPTKGNCSLGGMPVSFNRRSRILFKTTFVGRGLKWAFFRRGISELRKWIW